MKSYYLFLRNENMKLTSLHRSDQFLFNCQNFLNYFLMELWNCEVNFVNYIEILKTRCQLHRGNVVVLAKIKLQKSRVWKSNRDINRLHRLSRIGL